MTARCQEGYPVREDAVGVPRSPEWNAIKELRKHHNLAGFVVRSDRPGLTTLPQHARACSSSTTTKLGQDVSGGWWLHGDLLELLERYDEIGGQPCLRPLGPQPAWSRDTREPDPADRAFVRYRLEELYRAAYDARSARAADAELLFARADAYFQAHASAPVDAPDVDEILDAALRERDEHGDAA